MRDTGSPIVDLKPPAERSEDEQRKWLRLLHELNEKHASQFPHDTELAARIHSYELAYRMQTSAPEAIDISKETAATKKLYGVGEAPTDYFAPAGADGAAAGRARRPLRPDLLRRRQLRAELGRALGSQDQSRPALRRDRQADRRA